MYTTTFSRSMQRPLPSIFSRPSDSIAQAAKEEELQDENIEDDGLEDEDEGFEDEDEEDFDDEEQDEDAA